MKNSFFQKPALQTCALLTGLAAILPSFSAIAADRTWLNIGTDFNTASNWSLAPGVGSVMPRTNDRAAFYDSAITNPNVSSSATIQGILFSGSNYNLTSSPGAVLTLTLSGAGGGDNNRIIRQISSGTNFVSANIGLGGTADQGVRVENGGHLVISGNISGAQRLFVDYTANGSVTLSGNNTNTGGVLHVSPTTWLNLGSAGALGSGTFFLGGQYNAQNALFDNTSGQKLTYSNTVQLNPTGVDGGFDFRGSNDLTFSGSTALGSSSTFRLKVNAGRLEFTQGLVGSGLGSQTLTKQGAGTLILGDETHNAVTNTGRVTVTEGTLLLNGDYVGNTGADHFTVSGTTASVSVSALGGNGRLAGTNATAGHSMVRVNSGGSITPGDGIGTLTLDGANISGVNSRVLNMQAGSFFSFDLAGDGSIADQIAFWNYVSGDLFLQNGAIAINFNLVGPIVGGTYEVDLFSFFGDSGVTGINSGITSGLVIGTLGAGIEDAIINYNAGGDAISLSYTVIPEPTSMALLCGGLVTVLLFRRRTKS